MANVPDARSVLLGLVVGLVVGAVVGSVLAGGLPTAPQADTTPPTSLSRGGPSCAADPIEDAGWIHVVANGETWTVTLNATVLHPPGTAVEVNLNEARTGPTEIAFEVVPASPEKPKPTPACRLATSVVFGTAIDEPSIVVSVNGRTLRSIDQDETVATLYRLPNPIDATV